MNKKMILATSTFAVLAAPIVFSISCSNPNEKNIDLKIDMKSEELVRGDVFRTSSKFNSLFREAKGSQEFNNRFSIDVTLDGEHIPGVDKLILTTENDYTFTQTIYGSSTMAGRLKPEATTRVNDWSEKLIDSINNALPLPALPMNGDRQTSYITPPFGGMREDLELINITDEDVLLDATISSALNTELSSSLFSAGEYVRLFTLNKPINPNMQEDNNLYIFPNDEDNFINTANVPTLDGFLQEDKINITDIESIYGFIIDADGDYVETFEMTEAQMRSALPNIQYTAPDRDPWKYDPTADTSQDKQGDAATTP